MRKYNQTAWLRVYQEQTIPKKKLEQMAQKGREWK